MSRRNVSRGFYDRPTFAKTQPGCRKRTVFNPPEIENLMNAAARDVVESLKAHERQRNPPQSKPAYKVSSQVSQPLARQKLQRTSSTHCRPKPYSMPFSHLHTCTHFYPRTHPPITLTLTLITLTHPPTCVSVSVGLGRHSSPRWDHGRTQPIRHASPSPCRTRGHPTRTTRNEGATRRAAVSKASN